METVRSLWGHDTTMATPELAEKRRYQSQEVARDPGRCHILYRSRVPLYSMLWGPQRLSSEVIEPGGFASNLLTFW